MNIAERDVKLQNKQQIRALYITACAVAKLLSKGQGQSHKHFFNMNVHNLKNTLNFLNIWTPKKNCCNHPKS